MRSADTGTHASGVPAAADAESAVAAASAPPVPTSAGTLLPVLRDVAVYGLGDLLLRASSFITIPIYTRLFTPTDYGTMAIVVAVAGVVTAVLALGGDSAYGRYYFETKTVSERRELTSTWVWFLLGWTIAAALILAAFSGTVVPLLGAPRNAQLLLVLAFLAIPLSLVSSILAQVLRNQFRARTFSVINVAYTVTSIGLSLFAIVGLGLGLAGVFAGALAATVLFLPVRWWYAREYLGFEFSAARLRQLLAFGLPLVPVSVAYWIFSTADRVMLSRLASLSEAGLYAVANTIVGVLAVMQSALGQAWSPHMVKSYEEDPEVARLFAGRMLTWIIAVFGAAAVLATLFAREILRILASAPFVAAAAAVGPLSIAYVAYASTQVTAVGITLTKRTHYLMYYAWLAALINIVLNLLLIPRWGIVGASWATASAYLSLTLCYAFTTQRLWPIAWEGRKLLAVIVTVLLIMAAALALPPRGSVAVIGRILLMLVCVAFLWAALSGRWRLRALGRLASVAGARNGT